MPGGGYALPGLLVRLRLSVGPASNGAAGRWHQARSCFYAGWRLREGHPHAPGGAGAAETAGFGLNIGVPGGPAASARPEACRDKSKAPRSGDFAGRSPGVQGAAATGRPLCAPSAMSDIAQKKYWERNLSGNNIEAVALPGAVCTGKFTLVRK